MAKTTLLQHGLMGQLDDLFPTDEVVWSALQGLEPGEELNLYLVANGFKPATTIVVKHFYGYEPGAESEIVLQYRDTFDRMGLKYEERLDEFVITDNGKEIKSATLGFDVGKCQENLDALRNAKTSEEVGLAYGYPKEAAEAFQKVIDGEPRDGQYFQISLAKAKEAGIDIPSWLAYISHVPEQLNLVGGDVSVSSKELGERYQSFVRTHNPTLAERVEKTFMDKNLPYRLERTPNGSYGLYYRFNPASEE